MSLLANSFEGQTNGTTITAANSDDFGDCILSNAAGAGTYSTSQAMHGTVSNAFSYATGATGLYDIDDAAASGSFSVRFYLRLTAFPSVTNAQFPCNIRSLSANLFRLEMSTTGQVRISMTANSTYTSALSLNTWYRFEFYGTGVGTASTAATCDIYVGDNTGTPAFTTSISGQTTSAQAQRTRFGKISTGVLASIAGFFDDVAANIGSSTPLGPSTLNHTRTIDDTEGIDDDAFNQLITVFDGSSDTVGLSDTVTVSVGRNVSFADTLGLSDTRTLASSVVVTSSDVLGLSDNTTIVIGRAATFDEVEGLTDSVTVLFSQVRTQSDTIGLTDSIVTDQGEAINDTLGLTDSVTPFQTTAHTRQQDDPLGLTDSFVITKGNVYSDTEGLTDTLAFSISVVTNDLLGLSDSVGVASTGAINVSVNDQLGLTDAMSIQAAYDRQFADTLGLTDNIATTQERFPIDVEGLSDTLAIAQSDVFNDTLGLSDVVTVGLGPSLSFSDTLGLSDSIALDLVNAKSDTLGLSDTVTMDRVNAFSDLVALVDSVTVFTAPTFNDVMGLPDSITVSFAQVMTDILGLSDTVDVFQTVPLALVRSPNDLMSLTDTIEVEHTVRHFVPPFFTTGNHRYYVTRKLL
jgi:hypothetical protein